MSYTNAVFYLDPISGSDSARTALTTVTVANPSGTITRATKTAHGLVTGSVHTFSAFSAWLNDVWKITVVDANNFDLDGAVWQATADNNGTVTPFGGSSKADAWKTHNSGATAARIAPGDTIREIASPEPTSLAQSATFTNASNTITLTTAVTADISTCESAWTAGTANVTCTTSSDCRQGSASASNAINGTFTTGLAAYKALAGATDFSAYQQISLSIKTNVAYTSGQLQLKLCSDAAGVTAVNTINLPGAAGANMGWLGITVDTGGALGASIQSVALYVVTDFGAVTVQLDNIIACKASSADDALSLTSLVGKPWCLNWAASTTYAANALRKPTSPNRNGYKYKVTAGGGGASGSSEPTWPTEPGKTVTDGALTWTCDSLEETWWYLNSISGTTLTVGQDVAGGRGYVGTTESVTIYKREPTPLTQSTATASGDFQDSGSVAGGQITFSGGWNRTDMTTQTGETWLNSYSRSTGSVLGFNTKNYITVENISTVRGATPIACGTANFGNRLKNVHIASGGTAISGMVTSTSVYVDGLVVSNCSGVTNDGGGYDTTLTGRCVGAYSTPLCNFSSPITNSSVDLSSVEVKNSGSYAFNSYSAKPSFIRGLITENNTGVAALGAGELYVGGTATVAEATLVNASLMIAFKRATLYINNLNGAGANVVTDGGTITQSTSQRNTASGYSWLFNPTSTTRSAEYPLKLSVAKVACSANALVTLGIYVRRDSTNIAGRLMVRGGQIAGVGADASVACTPSINTWTQYTLTFTPTVAGVVEISFEAYDGVGTTNSLWIDDFSASQA